MLNEHLVLRSSVSFQNSKNTGTARFTTKTEVRATHKSDVLLDTLLRQNKRNLINSLAVVPTK